MLATRQAANNIRLAIQRVPQIWDDGHVSLGALWTLFGTYPYMPRLRDRKVLDDGVLDMPLLWQTDAFALANSYDASAGRYVGLWTPSTGTSAPAITDALLLVRPDAAQRQLESETAQVAEAPTQSLSPAGERFVEDPEHPGVHHRKTKDRFFGSKELNAERYAVDFKNIADEVISHLVASGAHVSVRVEIEADHPSGFDDAKIRTISENANTLKFDQSGFEEG